MLRRPSVIGASNRGGGGLLASVILLVVVSLLFYEHLFLPGIPFPAHTRALRPWSNDLDPQSLAAVRAKLNHTATDKNFSFHPDNRVVSLALREGRLPLWNPYQMAGLPLLGQSLYGVFYPLNLPLFLGDTIKIYAPLTIAHFLLAGLFTFLLLRRFGLSRSSALAGATIFMCCTAMTSRFHYYMTIYPMAWAPLMLYLADRCIRDRSRLGLCGIALSSGLILVAGFQQIAVYVLYLTLAYGLWAAAQGRYEVQWKRGIACAFVSASVGLGILACVFDLNAGFAYALGTLCAVVGFLVAGRGFFSWIKAVLPVAGALLLGVGLAAVQIAPTLVMLRHSSRALLPPECMVDKNCLPAMGWLNFFFPMLLTDPMWASFTSIKNFTCSALTDRSEFNYMENTLYIGILPLALITFVRLRSFERRTAGFFVFVCLFMLAMAFGFFFIVYLMWFLPGFQLDPRRTLVVISFAACVLAAFGLERLIRGLVSRRTIVWVSVMLLAGAGISYVLGEGYCRDLAGAFLKRIETSDAFVRASFSDERVQELLAENAAQIKAALAHFALASALAGIALLGFAFRYRRVVFGLLFATLLIDLLPLGRHVNPPQDEAGFIENHPSIARMQPASDAEHYRIFRYTQDWEAALGTKVPLPPNNTVFFRIEDAQGYVVQALNRYLRFCNGIEEGIAPPGVWVKSLSKPESLRSPLLDLAGIRYVMATRPAPEGNGWSTVYDDKGIYVLENVECFPRAFMVSHAVFMAPEDPKPFGESAVLKRMLSSDTDLRFTAVVESSLFEMPVSSCSLPVATVSYPRPEEVIVTFEGVIPGGVLVLCDSFYPGWKAWVDGEPTAVFPADLAFRGVSVPEGCKRVTFRYDPPEVRTGALISGACLIVLLPCTVYFAIAGYFALSGSSAISGNRSKDRNDG